MLSFALVALFAQQQEANWAPGDPESERPYWMNSEGGPAHPDAQAALYGGRQNTPSPPQHERQFQAPVEPPLFPFTNVELAAMKDAASAKASPFNYTWQPGFLAAGKFETKH